VRVPSFEPSVRGSAMDPAGTPPPDLQHSRQFLDRPLRRMYSRQANVMKRRSESTWSMQRDATQSSATCEWRTRRRCHVFIETTADSCVSAQCYSFYVISFVLMPSTTPKLGPNRHILRAIRMPALWRVRPTRRGKPADCVWCCCLYTRDHRRACRDAIA